jgi:hypothetical protein
MSEKELVHEAVELAPQAKPDVRNFFLHWPKASKKLVLILSPAGT